MYPTKAYFNFIHTSVEIQAHDILIKVFIFAPQNNQYFYTVIIGVNLENGMSDQRG